VECVGQSCQVWHWLYKHCFTSLKFWPNMDDWVIAHALKELESVLDHTTKEDRCRLREAVMDVVWSRSYVKQCMELRWGKFMRGAGSFIRVTTDDDLLVRVQPGLGLGPLDYKLLEDEGVKAFDIHAPADIGRLFANLYYRTLQGEWRGFTRSWLEDPHIKTYDWVVCDPTRQISDGQVFNTWQGFRSALLSVCACLCFSCSLHPYLLF